MCVNVLSCTPQWSRLCLFACLLWFNTPLCVCIGLFCLYMGLFCLNTCLVGLYIECIHLCLYPFVSSCCLSHQWSLLCIFVCLLWFNTSLCVCINIFRVWVNNTLKRHTNMSISFPPSLSFSPTLSLSHSIFFFGKTLDVCLQAISCILSWFFFACSYIFPACVQGSCM